jgi:hypothetical protein
MSKVGARYLRVRRTSTFLAVDLVTDPRRYQRLNDFSSPNYELEFLSHFPSGNGRRVLWGCVEPLSDSLGLRLRFGMAYRL